LTARHNTDRQWNVYCLGARAATGGFLLRTREETS
jgi:hypothetical protein